MTGEFHHDDPGNCYRETMHFMRHGAGGPTDFEGALDAADAVDSDADGVPNGVEILWPRPDGEVGYSPALAGDLGRDRCGIRGLEVITGHPETPPVQRGFVVVPPVIGFGGLIPGTMGRDQFVLRNIGVDPQTVSSVEIGFGSQLGFAVQPVDELPRVLLPGEELEFLVSYQEVSAGYFYQMLAWPEIRTTDATAEQVRVLLRQHGVPAAVDVEPVDFGAVEAGKTEEHELVVTNRDNLTLQLRAARWQDGGGRFRLAELIDGVELPAGGDYRATVAYAPSEEGRHRARLVLQIDDPFQPERVVTVRGESRRRLTRGDVNEDGEIDISDAISTLSALFLDGQTTCREAMDANDDGVLDLSDAVYLLELLFVRGGLVPETCQLETSHPYLGCPDGLSPCAL